MSGLSEQPPRILISRLSAHGDVVQTLPLLSDLKRQWPEAYIGWVVEASAAPLLENHPLIDRLHISHRKQWLKRLKNPLKWPQVLGELLAFIRELRQERYEAGLDVQGLFKSAVWLPLAGIPHRYGFEATREQAAIFYNHKLPYHDLKNPHLRTVDIFRSFNQAMGGKIADEATFVIPPVSETSRHSVEILLGSLPPHRPVIALAPFTRWESKTWPASHWQGLIQQLLVTDVQLILLGSPEDKAAVQAILTGVENPQQILNLAGKTSWTDLYALFQKVDLLIGMDSAPLHIANAVGHPLIIGLFGPTGPKRTGPVGVQHLTVATELSCQPCFERKCPLGTLDCMKQLTPEMVMAAVWQQLEKLAQPQKAGLG